MFEFAPSSATVGVEHVPEFEYARGVNISIAIGNSELGVEVQKNDIFHDSLNS